MCSDVTCKNMIREVLVPYRSLVVDSGVLTILLVIGVHCKGGKGGVILLRGIASLLPKMDPVNP